MIFPVHIALNASGLPIKSRDTLGQLVQADLDQQSPSKLHRLHVMTAAQIDNASDAKDYANPQSGKGISQKLTVVLKDIPDAVDDRPSAKLRPFEPVLDINHSLAASSHVQTLQPLAQFIAQQLGETFAEEQATITHLLASEPAFAKGLNLQDQTSMSHELRQRSNRAFGYASTYHLTFSLFSGSASPSSWDIKDALDDYLTPFLDSFSSISTFTVDTQVQLFASLSSSLNGPSYDNSSAKWTLQQSDLSAFVNAAEWPLSPSIGTGPTINFVVYVPAEGQAPLVVQESGGTSWLIPQWGGVQIVNPEPSTSNSHTLTRDNLEPVMHIFADQLESLLGLPRSPASLPLRLSSLARERTASLVLSASSTLGALARLTLKLTSIAIPENVAESVSKSIQHLEQACADLQQGRFDSALENARSAESQAEQAFFDPSMVGQVYFPDEHKVAVYVPLLGPMAVPLVMAAIKEIKRIRQTRSFSR